MDLMVDIVMNFVVLSLVLLVFSPLILLGVCVLCLIFGVIVEVIKDVFS